MGRAGFSLLMLASAMGGAQTAVAQVTPTRTTDLTFTLDTAYETNAARISSSQANLQGIHRSAVRITPGVLIDIARPFGRNSLRLNGFVGYDFYTRGENLNRARVGLSGDLGLGLGPCTLNLRPSFTRQRSQFTQLYYLGVPSVADINNVETIQSYGAEARCGRTYGLRPIVGYTYSTGHNSSSLREISDYRSNEFYGGVGYNNPTIGNFSLTYNRSRITYPDRSPIEIALGLADRYRQNSVRLEAERDLGAVITLKGSLAYISINVPGIGANEFHGIGWGLDGTVRPASRLSLTLSTAHQPEPALGSEALYSVNSRYAGTINYALTSRTSLFAGAERNRRNYHGAVAIVGPLLTDDRLDRYRAGASLKMSPRLTLSAEGGLERRNANGSIYDYHNSYVGLRAAYTL